jgi:hypothetical protein
MCHGQTRIIESSLKQIILFNTKIQYSTQPVINCSKKVLQNVPAFLGLSRLSSGEKSKHILQYKDKIVCHTLPQISESTQSQTTVQCTINTTFYVVAQTLP